MNSVITVNLGGNAYQLDEAGHKKLRAYLEAAEAGLGENPDKAEILADIEAAIGEKCRATLAPHKTVVTEHDIDEILKEMGPVAGGANDTSAAGNATGEEKKSDAPAPKRLYRISEGSMIAGVCTGIGAYFDIDVTIVRLLFVVLTFLTSGGFILAYVVMAIVVPKAATAKERAEASGTVPVTAQALIDRAQEGYTHFKNSKEWRQWKHTMKQHARNLQKSNRYHHARSQTTYPYQRTWADDLVQSFLAILWLTVIGFCLWFSYNNIPIVHDFINATPYYMQQFIDWVGMQFN